MLDCSKILAHVASISLELSQSRLRKGVVTVCSPSQEYFWTPPSSGRLKFNVDDGFRENGAVWGVILRDHLGRVGI